MPGEYGPTGAGRLAARTGACGMTEWYLVSCVSAAFDRPRWMRRPLAPRSDVELRAGEARVLHREQIVAGGDARTAVADHAIGRRVAERRSELRAKFFRRAKRLVGGEIAAEEMIHGARNVSRRAIDRLALAAKSFRRARVEERPV